MKRSHPALAILCLGLALGLASCTPSGGTLVTGLVPVVPRALDPALTTRKAVAYSGYRGSTRDLAPTQAEILEDLGLLHQAGFGLIRLFDSSDAHAKATLEVLAAHPELDLKVILGLWIGGTRAAADVENQAEIARALALTAAHPDLVLALSVGNETMVKWDFSLKLPVADMAAYIKQVRDAVSRPVTTDDNWAFFADDQGLYADHGPVLAAIDFVAMHSYPLADTPYDLWDWKQTGVLDETQRAAAMMDAALAKAKKDYAAVKARLVILGLDLPVIIGETGWKSGVSREEYLRAHPVNQKMYVDRLAAWTDGPANIIYFEAFDEPWKGGDDLWGLFDVGRLAKYVLYADFPTQREAADFTDSQAVYYIPPVPNPTITLDTYVAYRETAVDPATEAQPALALSGLPDTAWNGWNTPWTAVISEITSDSSEGSKCMSITPNPHAKATDDWGWGALLEVKTPEDLRNFAAQVNTPGSGRLRFAIKTTYPGKLEIGFLTGSAIEKSACDVYLPVAPGQYGYQNDGVWHEVSIPIDDITPLAAMAYGMSDPTKAKLDMTMVTNAFVIADRYAVTKNTTSPRPVDPILIDNIRWTKY